MQRIIDGRQWLSLSEVSTPLVQSLELSPTGDRALRPVELLSILKIRKKRDFSPKIIIEAQALKWASLALDGKFEDFVLQQEPALICHLAKIRDDALSQNVDIICCILEASDYISIATYEHVGLLGVSVWRDWIVNLTLLLRQICAQPFEIKFVANIRDNIPLLPKLASFLKNASDKSISQFKSFAEAARVSSDAAAMSDGILLPLQIMADHDSTLNEAPLEVHKELVLAGEHAALFGLRSQNEKIMGLAAGALARFLVDDPSERSDLIERGLRLSRYLCLKGPSFLFEQAALTHIIGVCRISAILGRDDAIETALWLIDILTVRPAEAARVIFRLINRQTSSRADKARSGLERLNRLDLGTYLLDTMLPLARDTSDLVGEYLGEADCPREIDFQASRGKVLFPPNCAPLVAIIALIARQSGMAQEDILGYKASEEILEELEPGHVKGLYLRSFRQIRRLTIPNDFIPNGSSILKEKIEPAVFSLESALHRAFCRVLHVFALAGPKDVQGMGRVYGPPVGQSAGRGWQERVVTFLKIVQLVVYVPDDTESMRWEASQIDLAEMIPHTIFVMLPLQVDQKARDRWNTFRSLDLPYTGKLPAFNPAGAFVWLGSEDSPLLQPFEIIYDHRLSDLAISIARRKK